MMDFERERKRKETMDIKLQRALRGGSAKVEQTEKLPNVSPERNLGKIEDDERKRKMILDRELKEEERKQKLQVKKMR